MRLLLDTHVVLWAQDSASPLSAEARRAIRDAEVVYVSAASAWEAAIKAALGKLRVPWSFERIVSEARFDPLPVSLRHADAVRTLSPIHGDPFDRMLIAQAIVEGLVLMTHDEAIARYPVALFRV